MPDDRVARLCTGRCVGCAAHHHCGAAAAAVRGSMFYRSEANVSQSSTMKTTQSFSIWEGDAIQLEICNLCQKTFEHSADEFQKFCEACRRDLEEFVDDERSISVEEEY